LLGRAFKGRRHQVVIATNFGSRFDGNKIVGMDRRPKHICEAVEGCLRRLGEIPGTKHRKFLEENVAAETVQLDPAEMKVLDDAPGPGKVSGRRYADWIMATIDR
jgi:aryl-alcohol dehydrogenase-like predicted oxidoreductase